MRTIICGPRDIFDRQAVSQAMIEAAEKGIIPTVILSGKATGIDALGEDWAKNNSIPIETYPADWNKHGKAAGPIRNGEMVKRAEACVAVWDGVSRGTRNCISQARAAGLKVHVHYIERT